MKTFLVTGGAGFIGSELVRQLVARGDRVVNLDKLTYAGNLESLEALQECGHYFFVQGDICDSGLVRHLLNEFRPNAIFHLAAESHVDRSIDGPAPFVQTNIVGTYTMLEQALLHWKGLTAAQAAAFRFLHISTDEVFGSLGEEGAFTEETPYAPRSPYSASKAGADHLARAWFHTYALPVVMSNCSNNYGPYQYPEKLIPLTVINAVERRSLPIYGNGENVRDWLHVSDHARALLLMVDKARGGASYNVGANAEIKNLMLVRRICAILDALLPERAPHEELITFVSDRPGHDFRYAIDSSKLRRELGWAPRENFDEGLEKTVQWYLEHRDWWTRIRSHGYQGERLGLGRQDPMPVGRGGR